MQKPALISLGVRRIVAIGPATTITANVANLPFITTELERSWTSLFPLFSRNTLDGNHCVAFGRQDLKRWRGKIPRLNQQSGVLDTQMSRVGPLGVCLNYRERLICGRLHPPISGLRIQNNLLARAGANDPPGNRSTLVGSTFLCLGNNAELDRWFNYTLAASAAIQQNCKGKQHRNPCIADLGSRPLHA